MNDLNKICCPDEPGGDPEVGCGGNSVSIHVFYFFVIVQAVEYFKSSGVGCKMVQAISVFLRNNHFSPPAKESFVKLLFKFLLFFGSNCCQQYLDDSELGPVSKSVIGHSRKGQWKKIKNIIKTLSK